MEPSRQSRRIRGNPRGQLPASLRAQDLPINEVLTMLQKVHIGLPTCEIARRTTTRASPVVTTTQPSSPKQAPSHNFMVEHVISPTASWRSSTTPPYLQTLRSQTKPCGASARTHWTWKAWAPSSGSIFRSATSKLDGPSTETMSAHQPMSSTSCSTDECMNGGNTTFRGISSSNYMRDMYYKGDNSTGTKRRRKKRIASGALQVQSMT